MQHWFSLSDPAMEEARYEITPMRVIAGQTPTTAIPDETNLWMARRRVSAMTG